jgi:hypothetical protein
MFFPRRHGARILDSKRDPQVSHLQPGMSSNNVPTIATEVLLDAHMWLAYNIATVLLYILKKRNMRVFHESTMWY